MTKWRRRKAEVVKTAERSSAKKKRREMGTLEARLDALGAEGWELVPYGARPMTGTVTNNVGYAYLSLFTHPRS
jgi:hypothetical protein